MTGDRAQIIGRYTPPDGEELRHALEFKESEGRLTLTEAILRLKTQTGEYFPLHDVVTSGKLKSYAPGSCKHLVGNIQNVGMDEEVYWDDVVDWLAVEYPRITLKPTHTETANGIYAASGFTMIETRQKLIEVFGKFTGMNASWFKSLKDTPALLAAIRRKGRGGRRKIEPLFCPHAVMQWLIDPKRKKGQPLSPEKGWQLLESNFQVVYNQYSIGDPRVD